MFAALVALLSGTSAMTAGAAKPVRDEPRSLGVPLRDVLLIGGTVGSLPDGRDVLWSATSGVPAHLNAVDPNDGSVINRWALEGAGGSWTVQQSPDGTVYVGTYGAGKLFAIDPTSNAAVDLGVPIAGETFVWSVVVDPTGVVWGGTYPGGKVFSYDPSTGAFTDHGQMAAGQTYVRSIEWYDGKIYAGAQAAWVITEYDPSTGEKRQLPLPPGVDPAGKTVYDLRVRGDVLYARGYTAFPGPLHLFDLTTGDWRLTVEGAAGLDVSPLGPGGRVWFLKQFEAGSTELIALDPNTGDEFRSGYRVYGRVANSRGIGWAELDQAEYPGPSIVGLLWRGLMFQYNPATGRSDSIRTAIQGEPTGVLALEAGPSGTVWAGGFLQGGLANVDIASGAVDYHRFSQIESLLWQDSRLYIGAYPDARVYAYDPSQDWYSSEYSDTAPLGTDNPAKRLDLKSINQSRLKALVVSDGVLVAGSTPANDTLGGALAFLDESTGEVQEIVDQFIHDEGILSLADLGDGRVIGTTTIRGGLATTPPTQAEATVFVVDVHTRELVWEANPVAGASQVSDVIVDWRGRPWIASGGAMVRLDVSDGSVEQVVELGVAMRDVSLGAGGMEAFVAAGADGAVRVDLRSGMSEQVVEQPASLVAYVGGHLVFADGAELFTVPVDRRPTGDR